MNALPLLPEEFFILRACKHACDVKTLHKFTVAYLKKRHPAGSTIPYKKNEGASLRQTYRGVKRLADAGLLEAVNLTLKPALYVTTPAALDLFSSAQNSNCVNRSFYALPRRARYERIQAIRRAIDVKLLTKERREEIEQYFEVYLGDTEELKIVLGRTDGVPKYLMLPYETRFNSEAKYKKNLAIYHGIWNEATKRYRSAVHLVLTTDPKLFSSVWHANRHFSKAFNRFMSYLLKTLKSKERPPYLSVYEYTIKGLMHAHVVIFGTNYLLPKRKITRAWERCGQGTYNYIYSLANAKGRWVYSRGQPKEIKRGQTAEDYLVKYLHKAKGDKGALYWAFNKRYFTNSRRLAGAPLNAGDEDELTSLWRFMFCCYAWDLPDSIVESDIFYMKGG